MGRTCENGSHTFLIVWVLFSSIAQQNLPCEGELGYKHSVNLFWVLNLSPNFQKVAGKEGGDIFQGWRVAGFEY